MTFIQRCVLIAGMVAVAGIPGYATTSYDFGLLSSTGGISGSGTVDVFGDVGASGVIGGITMITDGVNEGNNSVTTTSIRSSRH